MYRSYKNKCIDVHIDRYIMVFKWGLCYAFVLEPHPLPCVCLFVSNIYIYIYIYIMMDTIHSYIWRTLNICLSL